jgi:serine/threonine protein kinase
MAQLAHPNVVSIYDVGRIGDQVFLAMELVEGQTLRQWLSEGEQPSEHVLRAFTEAGKGLQAAHQAGLVHRDFKPDNVLVGKDGRVRVTDFGLARSESIGRPGLEPFADTPLASITQTGAVVGTPAYMAPEQYDGRPTDARSDQFSFCASLYEGLCGHRPFAGDTFVELAREVRSGRVREPKARVRAKVHKAIVRGLATRPEDRYPSMQALLGDLAPARSRAPWLLAAAACVLVAVPITWARVRRERPCRFGASKLNTIWNSHQKRGIQAAFLGSGKSYAKKAYAGVEEVLDQFVRSWSAMNQHACDSSELVDLRMRCLDLGLDELTATIEILSTADDSVIRNATISAKSLSRPQQCSDRRHLLAFTEPPDPELQKKLSASRRLLARAWVLDRAGRIKEALPIVTQVVSDLPPLGNTPLLADALYALGSLKSSAGDDSAAERALTEAVSTAESVGQDEVKAKSWAILILVLARSGRFRDAEGLIPLAKGAIQRSGAAPALEAMLEYEIAGIKILESQYSEALRHAERAIELDEPRGDEITLASDFLRRGEVLINLGRFAEALADANKSVRCSKAS